MGKREDIDIRRDKHGLWYAIRTDGLLIFRASTHGEVDAYIKKFGDVIEAAPPTEREGTR